MHAAEVTVSPLGIAPVCCGEQLELRCTTTGMILEWRFTLAENAESYSRLVSTTSIPANLTVPGASTTLFTFSRNSTQNSLPLISILSISPTSNDLNGTVVNCIDIATSKSSVTVINVISEHHIKGRYNYSIIIGILHICINSSFFLSFTYTSMRQRNLACMNEPSLHEYA